jgi:biotin-(acetyl-CoA carboxylase) ligase
VDSFDPARAVVGIGVNIANQPAAHDSALTSTAIRLADLLSEPPGLREVTEAILKSLRCIVNLLHHGGLTELCPRINAMWDFQRQVKLDLDSVEEAGWFCGVDEFGRLLLRDSTRHIKTFEPHQVKLLREI